jgi:hypothetical protein
VELDAVMINMRRGMPSQGVRIGYRGAMENTSVVNSRVRR